MPVKIENSLHPGRFVLVNVRDYYLPDNNFRPARITRRSPSRIETSLTKGKII